MHISSIIFDELLEQIKIEFEIIPSRKEDSKAVRLHSYRNIELCLSSVDDLWPSGYCHSIRMTGVQAMSISSWTENSFTVDLKILDLNIRLSFDPF